MATTKKTKASVKKPTRKVSSATAKKTTTRVTAVKAVPAAARPVRSAKFRFSRAPLLSASVAEFVGTFILAAVIIVGSSTMINQVYAFFAAVGIVLAVGALSGAHLNPLVTAGAWATRRVNAVRALCYVVAQVLGALLALVVLNAFVGAAPQPDQQAMQFGQQAPQLFTATEMPAGKEWTVLGAELLGSVLLAFMVASAFRATSDKLTRAFTYGAGLFTALLVAGYAAYYVNGMAILNPAVAASLQAIEWELWPLMVYVLTPLVGGVLGFALNDLLQNESDTVAQ